MITISFDPDAIAKSLGVTYEQVFRLFSDARSVSKIVEMRVTRRTGYTLAPSSNATWDAHYKGALWEVRCISRNGVYFCPASCVGADRKFDAKKFEARLWRPGGFLLADLSTFPHVEVHALDNLVVLDWWKRGLLGKNAKISQKKALGLLV